jgi:carboxypeptidase C (cathepsin A)
MALMGQQNATLRQEGQVRAIMRRSNSTSTRAVSVRPALGLAGLALAATVLAAFSSWAASSGGELPDKKPEAGEAEKPEGGKFEPFKPEAKNSTGTVTIGGQSIAYQAIAGTLIVHPKGWDDVARDPKSEKENSPAAAEGESKNPTAEASMFYVAYFKSGGSNRPVTFLYNGGPGSATLWLHMGAFGPRRIVTSTDAHTPAAPYVLVANGASLLDATDLVFIDAPGTGFSRIAGKDKEKAFFGVDQDAYAFAEFISQFLSKYGRWNSPKYLFGESYGTPRSAVLVNQLQAERAIDFNGVILLSQILSFDLSPDRPTGNPGIDLPYQTVLPTYAATAWYHHKLPGEHKDLNALLAEVEQFAMGEYGRALAAGSDLTTVERGAIAEKLHEFTGLPVEYILKADLRIDGGEFRQNLQGADGMTTGRLDSRFSGPDIDPLSQRAEYDPQSAALSSAYVAAFNEYARKDLHYGEGRAFKSSIPIFRSWNFEHQLPGQADSPPSARQGSNVLPDLANAMKVNPNLKIQLNAGYFDLATPFYQGVYEMHHLPIPASLQSNIEYKFYDSGHMVYAKDASLKALHDNVAAFIRRTGNLSGP